MRTTHLSTLRASIATWCQYKCGGPQVNKFVLYPDSGISMDEEIVLGDMIWSYNKAEL